MYFSSSTRQIESHDSLRHNMTHVHVLINTFKTHSRKYSMTPTNYTSTSAQANEIFPSELKRLWLMRILVKLNGLRRLFDDPSYYLLSFIGIEKINLSDMQEDDP